jgi:hypothetical protein
MNVALNEGPVAVEADMSTANRIKLDGRLRLEASRLETKIEPTDPSEEADNLQHFAAPRPNYPTRTYIEHSTVCVNDRAFERGGRQKADSPNQLA